MSRSARANARNYKLNEYVPTYIRSVSPPGRKFVKNKENTERHIAHKAEFSIPDSYIDSEQEEAQDFRIEIEKRYQKSAPNTLFVFPVKKDHDHDTNSGTNSSLDSLKHVTVYDLSSQNRNTRPSGKIDMRHRQPEGNYLTQYSNQIETERDCSEENDPPENEADFHTEIGMNGKQFGPSGKLIRLLETQKIYSRDFKSVDDKHQHADNKSTSRNEFQDKNKKILKTEEPVWTNEDYIRVSNHTENKNEIVVQASAKEIQIIRPNPAKLIDFRRNFKVAGSQKSNLKKSLSQEIPNRITNSERLLTNDNSREGLVYKGRKAIERFRGLYDQKTNTSKLAKPHPEIRLPHDKLYRQGLFKTSQKDSLEIQTPARLSSGLIKRQSKPTEDLYQWPQEALIQNNSPEKNRIVFIDEKIIKSNEAVHLSDSNDLTSKHKPTIRSLIRHKTPNDERKKISFADFYRPSPRYTERTLTISNSKSQENLSTNASIRALHTKTPLANTNNQLSLRTYDLSNRKVFKKPVFRLEWAGKSPENSRNLANSSRTVNRSSVKEFGERFPSAKLRRNQDDNDKTPNDGPIKIHPLLQGSFNFKSSFRLKQPRNKGSPNRRIDSQNTAHE